MCLVIDDMSQFLKGVGQKQIDIEGTSMKEKDAFNFLLNTILNQGRHLGTIILAVHST